MAEPPSDHVNEWVFPMVEVREMHEDNFIMPEITSEKKSHDKSISQPKEYNRPERVPVDIKSDAREETAKIEIENLKLEYERKLAYLNTLIKKLETPLSIFDDEFIGLMEEIIKKAVKKIICKDLATDQGIMLNIIAELKSAIQAQDGIIHIYLSEIDYQNLLKDACVVDDSGSTIIKMDAALSQGDIIIKSNFSEVRAILTERIDQILNANPDNFSV